MDKCPTVYIHIEMMTPKGPPMNYISVDSVAFFSTGRLDVQMLYSCLKESVAGSTSSPGGTTAAAADAEMGRCLKYSSLCETVPCLVTFYFWGIQHRFFEPEHTALHN